MNWPQREQIIARLLSEAAEQTPPEGDLAPRLHARLSAAPADGAPSSARPTVRSTIRRVYTQRPALRWATAIVSVALIAGMVFSAFVFTHRPVVSQIGANEQKTMVLHDAAWINRSVTLHHVTLQVQQGYADASRTALFVRLTTSTPPGAVWPQPLVMYVEDAQGHKYPGEAGAGNRDYSLIMFAPLTQSELSIQQTLTLVIATMIIPQEPVTYISGPWKVTFTIQPRVGSSVTFSTLPQTHNGITMQPLRLDLAPSGARLLVRVSGLKANTSLFALTFFAVHGFKLIGCPSGSDICMGGDGGGGSGPAMSLRGADGQTLFPNDVKVANDTAPDVALMENNPYQLVGATGSAVLDFYFYTPLHATHSPAQVSVAQLEEDPSDGVSYGVSHLVDGPWTFTLPLGK